MLLLSDSFRDRCHGATVYFDTNVFIHAFSQDDLQALFAELVLEQSTTFTTLSSVEYEFTRGVRSLSELKVRKEFIRGLTYSVLPVGKFLETDKNDVFSMVMSIVLGKKNSQYTDYLLAAALHTYKHIARQYVLSADVKAFPDSIFTTHGVITFMSQGEPVHLHLIGLDEEKYAKVLNGINA